MKSLKGVITQINKLLQSVTGTVSKTLGAFPINHRDAVVVELTNAKQLTDQLTGMADILTDIVGNAPERLEEADLKLKAKEGVILDLFEKVRVAELNVASERTRRSQLEFRNDELKTALERSNKHMDQLRADAFNVKSQADNMDAINDKLQKSRTLNRTYVADLNTANARITELESIQNYEAASINSLYDQIGKRDDRLRLRLDEDIIRAADLLSARNRIAVLEKQIALQLTPTEEVTSLKTQLAEAIAINTARTAKYDEMYGVIITKNTFINQLNATIAGQTAELTVKTNENQQLVDKYQRAENYVKELNKIIADQTVRITAQQGELHRRESIIIELSGVISRNNTFINEQGDRLRTVMKSFELRTQQ